MRSEVAKFFRKRKPLQAQELLFSSAEQNIFGDFAETRSP
jgi:hypothetical protein